MQKKVNWRFTPRGGYAVPRNIAAIALDDSRKRVRIAYYDGRTQQVKYTSVKPENLTPREKVSLPLDEIMIGEEPC